MQQATTEKGCEKQERAKRTKVVLHLRRASLTAWPTFPRQQVPCGFVTSQAHRFALISAMIDSTAVDLPVDSISSIIDWTV
jgi:hypothetical protein